MLPQPILEICLDPLVFLIQKTFRITSFLDLLKVILEKNDARLVRDLHLS
jgi:hypothetical protein